MSGMSPQKVYSYLYIFILEIKILSNLHFFRQSCLYNSGRPVLTGACKLGEQSDLLKKFRRFQWLSINSCKACKYFKGVSMVPLTSMA
jgi:hypothetical protein